MKILEAQSAVLTNYEVYTHLVEQKKRYAEERENKRGPGNLETIVRELLEYFRKPPSPLSSTPLPYTQSTIYTLLERLRPYNLTKAEVIQIMDVRPTHPAILQLLIQEFEERFPENVDETREDILTIISEVLGAPDEGEADKVAAARLEAEAQRVADKNAPKVEYDYEE